METNLIINFRNRQTVDVILMNNDGSSDTETIALDTHFDTVLVQAVDKILKRNRIETSSLKIVKVRGQVDPSSVAYHIALAVASALESKV